MTVEILPVGIKCNLKCTYCYQQPMRDAGNYGAPLKIENMLKALDNVQQDFALFGGEALLTPIHHLERLFAYGHERYKKNGVQTNGLLITDEHIKLFKRYNVNVGVSIDGPPSCNLPRSNAADTERIIYNILYLLASGVNTSLIVTIHKSNSERMDELLRFFRELQEVGLKYINLHNIEDDNCSGEALDNDSNFAAFRKIYDYSKTSKQHFLPFDDIRALLSSVDPNVSCIWNACDPMTTAAVHGISPDGGLVNCGRVNKDGIDWPKADRAGNERYISLWSTPQEMGGCQGCKYFFACKGNCPGTAIDGDWRNRTVDCTFWYQLIEHIERDMLSSGMRVISDEDKMKLGQRVTRIGETDGKHQDTPHGDGHGDHTDISYIFEQLIANGQATRVER